MLTKLSQQQVKVLSYYKSYIIQHGKSPTYRDAAEKFDMMPSAVHKQVERLIKLNYLFKDENWRISPVDIEATKRMPLVWEIACGEPLTVYESSNKRIEVPSSMLKGGGDFYALVARGKSMEWENGIYDWDILVIRAQTDANDGDIAVVIQIGDFDEAATLKAIYHRKDMLLLKPKNPRFSAMIRDKKNSVIRWKLMGIISTLDNG